MAKAEYWQRGEAIDFANGTGSRIEAGQVVEVGQRIGIAGTEIATGETGTLHVKGVFEFAKTDDSEIPVGTAVYFDGTGITKDADNGETGGGKVDYTPAGWVTEQAAADADTVRVSIG